MKNATPGFAWLRVSALLKIGPLAGILTLGSGCLAGPSDEPPVLLGADPAPCEVAVQHYQIDAITVPLSATRANELGLDLDGDEQQQPDNAGGSLLSAFLGQYATAADDLAGAIEAKLDDGRLRWVLAVETCAEGDDAWARVGLHRALDGDADGALEVANHPGPPAGGWLHGSMLRVETGFGPLPLSAFIDVLDGDDQVEWIAGDGVMIEATLGDDGALEGKLGVGLPELEARGIIFQRLAAFFTYKLERGESEFAVELDQDADGLVTVEELENKKFLSSWLAPDVDLFDETSAPPVFWPGHDGVRDRLSLGIGFRATPVATE